jgi:hypothetical protein
MIHVITHFSDSVGESTTSCMLSMKGRNFGTNGSELDKNNITKPTFDTLTEEGLKAFEAYMCQISRSSSSHIVK